MLGRNPGDVLSAASKLSRNLQVGEWRVQKAHDPPLQLELGILE